MTELLRITAGRILGEGEREILGVMMGKSFRAVEQCNLIEM